MASMVTNTDTSTSDLVAKVERINQIKEEIVDLLNKHKKKLNELTEEYEKDEWSIYEKLCILEGIMEKTINAKKTLRTETTKCKTLLSAIRLLNIPEVIREQHMAWCMENREILDVEREYVLDGTKYILTNKMDGNLYYYVQKTVIV
jgi:hypothetical protein